jgi:hypothetical protein
MTHETRRSRAVRLAILLPMALILALAVGLPAVNARIGSDLDPQLQADLEAAVRAKVSELLSEKDESGISYKRGSYSKTFQKVDDTTYLASFHQDTAGKDQVKTERLVLTLKTTDGVDWEVVDEELKDTFTGLYRAVWGDEEFFTFESFTLEREGLKVTATNGSLGRDYFRGDTATTTSAPGQTSSSTPSISPLCATPPPVTRSSLRPSPGSSRAPSAPSTLSSRLSTRTWAIAAAPRSRTTRSPASSSPRKKIAECW